MAERYTLTDLRRRVDSANGELITMGYPKRLMIIPTDGYGYRIIEVTAQDDPPMRAAFYGWSYGISTAGSMLLCEGVVNGYMRGVEMAYKARARADEEKTKEIVELQESLADARSDLNWMKDKYEL